MKPFFFPVVLLTPLDAAIWLWVDARMDGKREYAMHTESRKADRRDAEVMLWAQVENKMVAYHAADHGACIVNVRGGGGVLERYGAFA